MSIKLDYLINLPKNLGKFIDETTTSIANVIDEGREADVIAKQENNFQQATAEDRDLMFLHNTSADKLERQTNMGGLPMPSIAITKNDIGLESFGDITLIGKPNNFDPKTSKLNQAFSADAYTVRSPSPVRVAKKGAGRAFQEKYEAKLKELDVYASETISNIWDLERKGSANSNTYNQIVDFFDRHADELFLNEKGIAFNKDSRADILNKMDEYKDSEEFKSWSKNKLDEIFEPEEFFISNPDRDYYTTSARLKPYTADEVAKYMKRNAGRNTEGGMASNSIGGVRASTTEQLNSLKQMRDRRDRLVSSEDIAEFKQTSDMMLDDLQEAFKPYYKYDKDGFSYSSEFRDFVKLSEEKGIKAAADEVGFNPPDELVQELNEYKNMLRGGQTEYFEAKPKRVVSLDEFGGAIVPQGTDQATLNRLSDAGIEIQTYVDEASRTAARKKFGNLMFQVTGTGAVLGAAALAPQEVEAGPISKVVKEAAIAAYKATNPKALDRIYKKRGKNNVDLIYQDVRTKQITEERKRAERQTPKKYEYFNSTKAQSELENAGYRFSGASRGSQYYLHPDSQTTVRISDHEPVYLRSTASDIWIHPGSIKENGMIEAIQKGAKIRPTEKIGRTGVYAKGDKKSVGNADPRQLGAIAIGSGTVVGSLFSGDADAGVINIVDPITGAIRKGIEAYHGTPARFPPTPNNPLGEFDDAFIGTGEGVQAYGYGHYQADSDNVSEGYRQAGKMFTPADGSTATYPAYKGVGWYQSEADELGKKALSYFDDLKAYADNDPRAAARMIRETYEAPTSPKDQAMLDELFADDPLGLLKDPVDPDYVPEELQIAKWLEDNADDISIDKVGSLYRSEIDIDPDTMLDWDKTLSEQSAGVQQKIVAATKRLGMEPDGVVINLDGTIDPDATGRMLYNHIADGIYSDLLVNKKDVTAAYNADTNLEASKLFNEIGIPGIRYLDGDSRSAGKGSSNYVVFDPTKINIKERGAASAAALAATAAAGGAGMAMTSQNVEASKARLIDRGLEIVKSTQESGKNNWQLKEASTGKVVGSMDQDEFLDGSLYAAEVSISDEYRRQGVANDMYNMIEEQVGAKFKPTEALSDDGVLFWNSRDPQALRDGNFLPDTQDRINNLLGPRNAVTGVVGGAGMAMMGQDANARMASIPSALDLRDIPLTNQPKIPRAEEEMAADVNAQLAEMKAKGNAFNGMTEQNNPIFDNLRQDAMSVLRGANSIAGGILDTAGDIGSKFVRGTLGVNATLANLATGQNLNDSLLAGANRVNTPLGQSFDEVIAPATEIPMQGLLASGVGLYGAATGDNLQTISQDMGAVINNPLEVTANQLGEATTDKLTAAGASPEAAAGAGALVFAGSQMAL